MAIETSVPNRNKSPRCSGALAASVREAERWNSVTSFLRGGSNFFSLPFFPRTVERGREGKRVGAALQTTGAPRQPACCLTHRDRSRLAAHACTFALADANPPPFLPSHPQVCGAGCSAQRPRSTVRTRRPWLSTCRINLPPPAHTGSGRLLSF